jgi:hypothetical protein
MHAKPLSTGLSWWDLAEHLRARLNTDVADILFGGYWSVVASEFRDGENETPNGVCLKFSRGRWWFAPAVDVTVVVRPWATVLLCDGEVCTAAVANRLLDARGVWFGADLKTVETEEAVFSLGLDERPFTWPYVLMQ